MPALKVYVLQPDVDARGMAGRLVDGDDVGILDGGRVDHPAALHVGQAADAVAGRGRALELHRLRGTLHLNRELLLHRARLARQEVARLPHQMVVGRLVDAVDAGSGAALDLVQQAGASAGGEHTVGAGAQQEHALHRGHGLIDRPG